MNGIILIDKPKSWTSFDVVNKVRSTIEQGGLNNTGKKRFPVGHTGTLDPLATGLLVILLGGYTKRAPELSKADKTYEVTMKLGQTSTTGDEEGQKTLVCDKQPSEKEVLSATEGFVGEIEQTPPLYSAIKINGKRAYKLARQGKKVEMKPRKATIYKITDIKYDYPTINFTASVTSGTYIRTLVEDIGQKLGIGAYTTELRRTRVGDFNLENAYLVEQITSEYLRDNQNKFNIDPKED